MNDDDEFSIDVFSEPATKYATAEQWAEEWLWPIIGKPRRYDASNLETQERLWASWQAWEQLYPQGGTGPSMWWNGHLFQSN